MQQLSQEVQLSFKEVNKWLWDQKQRISGAEKETPAILETSAHLFSITKHPKNVGSCKRSLRICSRCHLLNDSKGSQARQETEKADRAQARLRLLHAQ